MLSERQLILNILDSRKTAEINKQGELAALKDGVFLRGICCFFFVTLCLLAVLLIAMADLAIGPDISLCLFYLIPLGLCAWYGGLAVGTILALICTLTAFLVDYYTHFQMSLVVFLWNGIVRFGTFVFVSSLVVRLHRSIVREKVYARTDSLTGAVNAKTFYECVIFAASQAGRTEQPITLAYIDLDNFKTVNDQFGHAEGDRALLAVVEVVRQHTRETDILGRLGGDEFALLLPYTNANGGVALLYRVQKLIAEEMKKRGWPITLSIGAITFHAPFQDVDRMMNQVDALMYSAKKQGKNRLEHLFLESTGELHAEKSWFQERRVSERHACNRAAKIRVLKNSSKESDDFGFVTIKDVSKNGVGVLVEKPLVEETLIVVEPLFPGPKTLLGKIVHVSPIQNGWILGCSLYHRLQDEELEHWINSVEMPGVTA